MTDNDTWDEPGDETWWQGIRPKVLTYLQSARVAHGRVGERPAWHLAPYVSLWAVESYRFPESVGWWVICGDLPTDYCSSDGCRHPRLALRRIVEGWRAALGDCKPGDQTIGRTGIAGTLADLLQTRVELLADFADDDGLWPIEKYG